MTPAPSDADKPASGPAGAKPDASRPLPTGSGAPGKDTPGATSPAPKVGGAGEAPKPEMKPETKPAAAGGATTPGTSEPPKPGMAGGETKPEIKPAGSAGSGAPPAASGPAGTPPKPGLSTTSPTGAPKAEPPKPEPLATGPRTNPLKPEPGKAEPGKAEPGKPDLAKSETAKPDLAKPEAAKSASVSGADALRSDATKTEASKTEASKPDPAKAGGPGVRPGGPAGPVAGAAVTAGPILDLKATRVPEAGTGAGKEAGKEASKDAGKEPPKAPGPAGQAKASEKAPEAPASRPQPTATPPRAPAAGPSAAASAPPAGRTGAGFGSIAAAGLIGGVLGAGLLFAAEKAGIGGEAGQLAALDQKVSSQIAALDQRIGGLASKEALGALDKRVAAAEASAKASAEAGAAPAGEKAAGQGQGQGVPPDLAARLDSLDQRVSALQEEPGRDAPGNGGVGVAQVESSRQLADLDARVKALEGNGSAGGNSGDTAQALASLKGDVETRTKQNAEAVASLGQRLDSLQQSLGERVKSATEAVQAATEASRKAAEAHQNQAAEAAKSVDRKLTEQGDRIAALDKGLADRAPAATVQAALRVVVADRIASALASGAPYAEPLATLAKLDPQAQGQAAALTPFAEKGAPTVGQLAETFRGIGQSIAQARQAARTKAAAESGDFRTKLLSMADGLVQVRKVDAASPAEGPASAPEEKVQAALDRGDLEAAAAAFETLPDEAKAQAKDFGATLAARAKAAQASRSLTASAFAALPAPASK